MSSRRRRGPTPRRRPVPLGLVVDDDELQVTVTEITSPEMLADLLGSMARHPSGGSCSTCDAIARWSS